MQTGDINYALGDACRAGSVEMVTVLLDLGADVNYQDEVKQNLNSTCASTVHVIYTDWSYPIYSLGNQLFIMQALLVR
jgi:ankyrin repeat protein